MHYAWNFSRVLEFSSLWIQGTAITFLLTGAVLLFGTLLSGLLVVGQRGSSRILRFLCRSYIDLMSAIPALVLIGTLYFALPILTGLRLSPLTTTFLALSLNLSPFAAECIRAGIESIPTLQYDSARALGFTGRNLSYYIIAPQVARRVLPPLAGQYITTLKLTSLAATVGVPEIWHVVGQVVTATSLPLEARLLGTGMYIVIILPLLLLVHLAERRFNVKGLDVAWER